MNMDPKPIDIVFAEFGKDIRLPDVANVQQYFKNANIQIYGEEPLPSIGDPDDPNYGWRMNDYWKVAKLLESPNEVAIAMDSDMKIVSPSVVFIRHLATRFGLCLPANPRKLVAVDNMLGRDAQRIIPQSMGSMYAVNCGIIALDKRNKKAVECVETFLNIMRFRPMRGPLAWAEAIYELRFAPCLLPPQWCVCAEDIGCGNEIVLHVGHEAVRKYYGITS